MNTSDKLRSLREQMQKLGIDAFLQPVNDEYMSEYPPACNRRVEWLTGFAGSAGTVAVMGDNAAIFIDGRYTLQADKEVDNHLFERHNSGALTPEAWLAERLKPGQRVGYDASLHTQNSVARIGAALAAKKIELAAVENPVDAVWQGRPAQPESKLFMHELCYSGEASASKRRRVADELKKLGADAMVIAAPDTICWLLNVRAADVENSPLVLAKAILTADGKAQLFIAPERCSFEVRDHFGDGVEIKQPADLAAALAAQKGRRVLCDPAILPVWYAQTLEQAGADVVKATDPSIVLKASKNATELQGMRNAHVLDGVSVTKLLHWLDTETKKRPVKEMEVCDQLLAFRKIHPLFTEPSFPTISGSGPNGAIVHYRVSAASNRTIGSNELFLLDSGGQYHDGTTDITRTVVIGEPTPEHKDRFTRVLKGHIAIATAHFPAGTKGSQIDALARQYLWQAGLDYDHGTGHGVGCFLNVHEGPQRISKRGGDAEFVPGMIVSNEPGYYKSNEYGIRIESLVAVVEKTRGHYCFETITCAPIDTKLVDAAMLTPGEKHWLNEYHAAVFSRLELSMDDAGRGWLKKACAAI